MDSMHRLIVSFFVGLLGAVVGAISANYFWRRQRHADLCLDSLRRLHDTAAELLKEMLGAQDAYEASDELINRWVAAATEIEDLLPGEAYDKLNELTYSITNDRWDPDNAREFSDMRHNAFRQLYASLDIPPFPWKAKQKVKCYVRTSTSWLRSLLFRA